FSIVLENLRYVSALIRPKLQFGAQTIQDACVFLSGPWSGPERTAEMDSETKADQPAHQKRHPDKGSHAFHDRYQLRPSSSPGAVSSPEDSSQRAVEVSSPPANKSRSVVGMDRVVSKGKAN